MRLIDADALLNTARMTIDWEAENINDAPTVDAMPIVHGYWYGDEYDGYADDCPVYYSFGCSLCNNIIFDEETPEKYSYCPYCGTKMDGNGKV